MAQALARGRFIRIAPRKMRLVADMIRGRKVEEARNTLEYTVKGAAPVLLKILESAVANAESKAAESHTRINPDEMIISKLLVNEGMTLKRGQPRARGRRNLIRKRTSHVELVISDPS